MPYAPYQASYASSSLTQQLEKIVQLTNMFIQPQFGCLSSSAGMNVLMGQAVLNRDDGGMTSHLIEVLMQKQVQSS